MIPLISWASTQADFLHTYPKMKQVAFISANVTVNGIKYWIDPCMNSWAETTPEKCPTANPAHTWRNPPMMISSGIISVEATTFGSTRYDAEFTPMISKASICSEMRIVPNSEAMLEPIFPARIRQVTVGAISMMVELVTIDPIMDLESSGVVNW